MKTKNLYCGRIGYDCPNKGFDGRCKTGGRIEEFDEFKDCEHVVEVKDDFAQWHLEFQLYTVCREICLIHEDSAFVDTKFHDRTDKFVFSDNLCYDERLVDMI